MKNLREILFDQKEKIVAILGNNVVQKFLSTGVLGEGFAILSDKRLYFRGKCLYKKGKGFYTSHEEKAVDLKDVTGTGFEHINPTYLLAIGVSFITAALIVFLIAVLSF